MTGCEIIMIGLAAMVFWTLHTYKSGWPTWIV